MRFRVKGYFRKARAQSFCLLIITVGISASVRGNVRNIQQLAVAVGPRPRKKNNLPSTPITIVHVETLVCWAGVYAHRDVTVALTFHRFREEKIHIAPLIFHLA